MHFCGELAEDTTLIVDNLVTLLCGSNPFCYSTPELVHMRRTGVVVLDWNLPRVGTCAPACCAVGPVEMLDNQPALPMMCEHHQSWFDKLLVRRRTSVFSAFVGTDLAADTGPIPDPVIIRGFRLIMATYMTVGGTGFHEQVTAHEHGYTDWQEFALALYQDDLATLGYQ